MMDKLRDVLIIVSCVMGIIGWAFVIIDKILLWTN